MTFLEVEKIKILSVLLLERENLAIYLLDICMYNLDGYFSIYYQTVESCHYKLGNTKMKNCK